MNSYMRVRADIDLDAIHHNLWEVKNRINRETKLMAVIKADGYGHGAEEIAKYCDDVIDSYAVAIVEEGAALRKQGFTKPTLVLGYTHPSEYPELFKYNLMPTVFTYDMAESLSELGRRLGKTAKIHIKLDTGMGRIGFIDNSESIAAIEKIANLPNIEINGIFTHLARADEFNKAPAEKQFKKYNDFVNMLNKKGIEIPNRHISNSAAIMELEHMNLEIVRSGIITYGLYPSEDVDKSRLNIIPAMEIKSHISYIKTLPVGVEIGYGGTYVTDKKTVVATIPVGYADGYPRSLSNKGSVLIRGKRAPIIGRVCMDQFMVDITHIPEAEICDEVVLMGKSGKDSISCEEVSALANSFNYEFVCNISKRVPRVYRKNNEIVKIARWI